MFQRVVLASALILLSILRARLQGDKTWQVPFSVRIRLHGALS
jgi:hypothetical protein